MKKMICKEIDDYINKVETGKIIACEEQKKICKHIKNCFKTEKIYINKEQLKKYLSLLKYFNYERLFEWEIFLLTLFLCTYWKKNNNPRWDELFCLVGRGAGKDGFIAFISMCLLSQYNGIMNYDIDICANNETQAVTPVKDLVSLLDIFENKNLKSHFYGTKEMIEGLKTKSVMKGRTNSPKGKDGLRSGCVIFNEVHQYENYANIDVFTTGLGKKDHPRRGYFTTQGNIREGVLDDLIEKSEMILKGEISDNGFLPFICKLDKKEEVHDFTKWHKANPSLIYKNNLYDQIKREYYDWKNNPAILPAFMTKRMNIPDTNSEIQVTEWKNIEASNKDIPDLIGNDCVVGIDYALMSDFVSVNFHFKDGDKRYDINHSWVCLKSRTLSRIKAPWKDWVKRGLLTAVDDQQIRPALVTKYIEKLARDYNILKIAIDNYRLSLFLPELEEIGFTLEEKNLKVVRPPDIMQVVPVIDSVFNGQNFTWGDNPVLRWATNNAKLIRSSKKIGSDTGNFYYGKIESKSRKTDPFMALVHSMVIESELKDYLMQDVEWDDRVMVF